MDIGRSGACTCAFAPRDCRCNTGWRRHVWAGSFQIRGAVLLAAEFSSGIAPGTGQSRSLGAEYSGLDTIWSVSGLPSVHAWSAQSVLGVQTVHPPSEHAWSVQSADENLSGHARSAQSVQGVQTVRLPLSMRGVVSRSNKQGQRTVARSTFAQGNVHFPGVRSWHRC